MSKFEGQTRPPLRLVVFAHHSWSHAEGSPVPSRYWSLRLIKHASACAGGWRINIKGIRSTLFFFYFPSNLILSWSLRRGQAHINTRTSTWGVTTVWRRGRVRYLFVWFLILFSFWIDIRCIMESRKESSTNHWVEPMAHSFERHSWKSVVKRWFFHPEHFLSILILSFFLAIFSFFCFSFDCCRTREDQLSSILSKKGWFSKIEAGKSCWCTAAFWSVIPTSNSYPLQCQQKQETRNKKQENKTKQTKKKNWLWIHPCGVQADGCKGDSGSLPCQCNLSPCPSLWVDFESAFRWLSRYRDNERIG